MKELRIVVSAGKKYQFPKAGIDSFFETQNERYIFFINEAGKELTGEAFDNAKAAFIEAGKNDDVPDDGKWYGWSLKGESQVKDTYTVTINVKKDGQPWNGHGRSFALLKNSGGFITGLTQVPNGTYRIYDITGVPADSLYSKARDTGMDVRVSGMDTA